MRPIRTERRAERYSLGSGGRVARTAPRRRGLAELASGGPLVDTTLSVAPGIAASVGTPIAVSAVGGAATAAGIGLSVAIPVAGAVVGALIASLFAAHEKRVADAKQENQVLTSLIPTVIQAISSVFSAANAGQCSAQDAIGYLAQIEQNYWQAVQQVEGSPGQAGGPQKCVPWPWPATKNPVTCDRSCTASCCIGCNVVEQWIGHATSIFKGTANAAEMARGWGKVIGNSYGLQNFTPPNWAYTPPPASVIAANVLTNNPVSSAVSNVLGGPSSVANTDIFGIPLWMLGVGGILALLLFRR